MRLGIILLIIAATVFISLFLPAGDLKVATKYPGYFFNTADNKLYSMKVSGVLRPLRFYTPNQFNHQWRYLIKLSDGAKVSTKGGYYISFQGSRRFYPIEKLKDIKPGPHVIPVKEVVC